MRYIARINKISLQLFFVSIFLVQLGFFIKNPLLTSVSNNLSVIFIMLLFFRIYDKIEWKGLKKHLIILGILLLISLSKFIFFENIDARESIFIFVLINGIFVFSNLSIKTEDLMFLRVGIYIVTLFYFIGSFFPENIGFYPENFLMFGYSNPNVLAPILLTHIIYIGVPLNKSINIKILDIFVILSSFYMIYLTGSRTVMLAATILLFGIITKLFRLKFIYTLISKILIFFPIVLIFFNKVLNLFAKGVSFLIKSDKVSSLNGRDIIWSNQISELITSPGNLFFGIPVNTEFYRDSHNYLLFIFSHHGIGVLFLYLFSLFNGMKNKINILNNNELNYYTLYSWNIIIMVNFFESHLSTGLISISFLWLMLLSNYEGENNQESEKLQSIKEYYLKLKLHKKSGK